MGAKYSELMQLAAEVGPLPTGMLATCEPTDGRRLLRDMTYDELVPGTQVVTASGVQGVLEAVIDDGEEDLVAAIRWHLGCSECFHLYQEGAPVVYALVDEPNYYERP